ncbi:MAG: hypothetical protein PHF24_07775 [Syntrophomonas sp.]|nr:hypothetical protein [Syntrophomonas sp.]
MNLLAKDYHKPKCPDCDIQLLYQEAYLKARTYQINSEGMPGNINLTPNPPEVLEFKHLICGGCNQSFAIIYDKNGRINRGSKS